MALKETFYFNSRAFNDFDDLAIAIAKNFTDALYLVENSSLFGLFEREKPELYTKLIDATKDFEYNENILTLAIYMMSNTFGIVTRSYTFKSNFEIAAKMKQKYPEIDSEVKILFSDKVLSYIYLNEYEKSNDIRAKRNYAFMLSIYENKMYDFTYFYFLFMHLEKNETIRFKLDGVTLEGVRSLANHLADNISRSEYIISDILANPYILALIAVNSSLESTMLAVSNENKYEIVKVLSKFTERDLKPVITKKMSYWLLFNYKNYLFETDEAKKLYLEYERFNKTKKPETLADLVDLASDVDDLYKRFVSMFNNNKIVQYKKGFYCADDDYYLSYVYNDDLVCKKFLIESGFYDESIHTETYKLEVEKELLVLDLTNENNEIEEFEREIHDLTDGIVFGDKSLRVNASFSICFCVLNLALLIISIVDYGSLNGAFAYVIYGLGFAALIASIVSFILFNNVSLRGDFVSETLSAAKASKACNKKEIDKINGIVDPSLKIKLPCLENKEQCKLNRVDDLKRIKLYTKLKNKRPDWITRIPGCLTIIPFNVVTTYFILLCMKHEIGFFGFYGFNFLPLFSSVVGLVLIAIFGKRKWMYFVYPVSLVISFLLCLFI